MKKVIAVFFLLILTVSLYAKPPVVYEGKDGSIKPGAVIMKDSPFLKSSAPSGAASYKVSSSGTKYIPVVLVQFPDRIFNAEHDRDYYKELLQTGSSKMTMTGYYDIMSGSALDLKFEIFGPYTMPNSISYYGKNENGNPDSEIGELVLSAVDFMVDENEAAYFNSSSIFDSDRTGGVDVLMIIFAGMGEDSSGNEDEIWAHQCTLQEAADVSGTYHNFNYYTIQSERSTRSEDSAIGAPCHEFGHILGLPDLYDVSYETRGVGNWSIMSGGSWGSVGTEDDPAPLLAFERYKLGWLTPETLVPDAVRRTVSFSSNVEDPSYKAYRINLTDDGSQYLIMEGKKRKADRTGMFVPESGLLITQIHEGRYNLGNPSNRVNVGKDRIHAVDVLEARPGVYAPSFNYTGSWGALWTSKIEYSPATFGGHSRTGIGPSYMEYVFAGSLLLMGISLYRRKGRIRSLFLTLAAVVMLSVSCSLSGGSSIGQFVANTNYYKTYSLESKTGNSGVVIDNITFDEASGTGSFTYYLDFSSGK